MDAPLGYYWGRALDRLEQHGLPLRNRSLLFFLLASTKVRPSVATYAQGGVIGPVSEDEFRSFHWPASPSVIREALERRHTGRRWPIAARRGNQMDGFCWLEADTADMFHFDLEYEIPADTRYVGRVWVCPQVRGQGLGRALLVAAETFAAESGATHLSAACVPQNRIMRALFGELGWDYQQRVDYLRAGPACLFRIRKTGEVLRSAWTRRAAARLLATHAARPVLAGSADPSAERRPAAR